jgi:hypothetical protein
VDGVGFVLHSPPFGKWRSMAVNIGKPASTNWAPISSLHLGVLASWRFMSPPYFRHCCALQIRLAQHWIRKLSGRREMIFTEMGFSLSEPLRDLKRNAQR